MLLKISVAIALFALLGWSFFKLLRLSRKQKILKRSFREPIINSKLTSAVSELEEELTIENEKQESDLDDIDLVLGLKSSRETKINKASTSTSTPTPASTTTINDSKSIPVSGKAQAPTTIAIHLMAPANKPYMGYELLQALLAEGLRFGLHNIFHRHENKSGSGEYLFHLASVNAPGTFEMSKMGSFSCPGLSLFMQLNDKIDNTSAFEVMLDTANELQNELGGELWDEQRKVLGLDKITEYRLRIKEYQQQVANRLPDFFEQYS